MALFKGGEERLYTLSLPAIIYLLDGSGIAVLDDESTVELNGENLYLITAGTVTISAGEKIQAIICPVTGRLHKQLLEDIESCRYIDPELDNLTYAVLRSNALFKYFYTGIGLYLDHEMNDEELLSVKATELRQIIIHSTSRREYMRFFTPLLKGDYLFDMFVHDDM